MKPTTELQKDILDKLGKGWANGDLMSIKALSTFVASAIERVAKNAKQDAICTKHGRKGCFHEFTNLTNARDTSGREIVCTIKQPVWDEQESKEDNG